MFKCRTVQADGSWNHHRGLHWGRMSHCEEVVLVLTLATSRRASVKSILKGEQQIKLRNKDKKKKSSLLTWFKISFQPFSHFALPPTQLHGSSHNFIQLVAVSFHKKILLYYNIILNDLIVSAENQKYCLMYVPHLTPLSLNVHHSTGSHLTHACWVCYHSYNTIPTPPPFSQTIICRLFPPIGSHGWRCSMK